MINALVGSAERVQSASTAVAIAVIVLLFLSYAGLFYLYYRYFSKSIENELEDGFVLRDMVKRSRRFFLEAGRAYEERKPAPSYQQHLKVKARSARTLKIIGNTALVVCYLGFLGLMAGAIAIRAQGDSFLIGNKSYLVIRTGSMEEKNPANAYLYEEGLDDQIMAYSLIEIETVEAEEMELYKVYAFKVDGVVLVHRLIAMGSNGDGEMRYAFRGDSNATSGDYEVSVPIEDILGVYTGWNSFSLGLFVNYAQSSIGIITIALALILIGFYDIVDAMIGKKIKEREDDLTVRVELDLKDRFTRRLGYPYLQYLDNKLKPHEIIPPFDIAPIGKKNQK